MSDSNRVPLDEPSILLVRMIPRILEGRQDGRIRSSGSAELFGPHDLLTSTDRFHDLAEEEPHTTIGMFQIGRDVGSEVYTVKLFVRCVGDELRNTRATLAQAMKARR